MVEVNQVVASQIQEKRSSELFAQSYPPDTGRKEKRWEGREKYCCTLFDGEKKKEMVIF